MNEFELILTDICDCSRSKLYADSSSIVLGEKQLRRLDTLLDKRAKSIPVHYSLGYVEFMGLRFKVDRSVLIPRSETEIVVESVIEIIKNLGLYTKRIKVLDIGTGSGCIAISLAKYLDGIDIVAIDKSKSALKMASENAKLNNAHKRINFLYSDLFSNKAFTEKVKFDVIVSNPPYVPTSQIGLFDITTVHEPKLALDGGVDGYDVYRKIARIAGSYLCESGLLVLEIGDGQSLEIKNIFSKSWYIKELIKDYQGIERVCILGPKK